MDKGDATKTTVLAMRLDIFWIAYRRIFIAKPNAMRQYTIAQRAKRLWQAVRNSRHIGKAHAGLDQADVGHHMIIGGLIEMFLPVIRRDITNDQCS